MDYESKVLINFQQLRANIIFIVVQFEWNDYRTLVGISGRITTYDAVTGLARYKNWQYTWWNGFYNIMLTKGALFHKNYLAEYTKVIPSSFLKFIDEHRNCEDLAMAYVISIQVFLFPLFYWSIFMIPDWWIISIYTAI